MIIINCNAKIERRGNVSFIYFIYVCLSTDSSCWHLASSNLDFNEEEWGVDMDLGWTKLKMDDVEWS
jgi:hypothetical protein